MPGQAQAVPVAEAVDHALTLAAWRARGLHRFDPVRFRFIEALARRTADQTGDLRQVLDGRLASLLSAYGMRQEQALAEASETVARGVERFPAAADPLRRCLADSDFKALHRRVAELAAAAGPAPSLGDLVRHIERQGSAPADGRLADTAGGSVGGGPGSPPIELKAVRAFRSTWARLRVDQQLTRSLARAPEQAGPLNSQVLVLRSLQRMRDVSPAYLGRFMSYIDALTWLDEAAPPAAPAPGATPRGDVDKKRKPGRGRGG